MSTPVSLMLRIPEAHKPALRKLISLDAEFGQALFKALEKAEPAASPDGLASSIASDVSIPLNDLREIIAALLSLALTRETYSISTSKVVDDVLARAVEENLIDDDPETVSSGKQRLSELLSLERSVGVSSRVLGIISEHKHAFVSARILTDMRPVFSAGEDPTPLAGMIVHNLKLETHVDGRHKDFFVALDARDLKELRDVIDRAIRKETALKVSIVSGGISYVDP